MQKIYITQSKAAFKAVEGYMFSLVIIDEVEQSDGIHRLEAALDLSIDPENGDIVGSGVLSSSEPSSVCEVTAVVQGNLLL